MKENRFDRAKLFEEFQKNGKSIFEKFKADDKKHKRFDDYYSLCICPKGRNGGIDNRIFEVFYGGRIFDLEKKIKADLRVEEKYVMEYGTTLSFNLNDHGYIAIILYPSGTERTKALETAIFVENHIHPDKLMDEAFLKKQWNWLNSYMECTSIDGCPSLMEKIRYYYLKYCKNLVIDGKFQRRKIVTHSLQILKFAFTVGLSGFLIFLFTIFPNRGENEEIKQIKETNTNLKELIETQTLIKMKLDSIHSIMQSDSTFVGSKY
ncbi:MAG: hypothetical protein LBR52_00345 [Prevotellaceae bacterium]|jgi:hypothetical protein|nr:hypothetical protein [Prevotellaceae bacterium]